MADNIKIVGSILSTTQVSRYAVDDLRLIASQKIKKSFNSFEDYIEYALGRYLNDDEYTQADVKAYGLLCENEAEKLKNENNIEAKAGNIIVTPGAKQAIFEVALSVLQEGDEAILFDPAWVSYDPCVKLSGARTVWAATDRDNGF